VPSRSTLSRNISWNYIQAGTNLLVYVLLTPVVVAHLGDVGFGLWVLLNGLLFYLRFLDLGFHSALVKYIAEYTQHRDWSTVNGLIGATTSLLAIAGATALAFSGAIAWLIIPSAFHVPPERISELQFATVLLGLNLLLAFPASVFGAVFQGRQRFDVVSAVSIASSILCAAGTVIGLELGYGIIALVCIEIARTLITAAAFAALLRRLSPETRISLGPVGGPYLRAVRGYSTWTSLNEILAEGGAQIEKLLVPIMLSVSLLTPYSLICAVAAVLFLVVEPVTDTFFPLSSTYHATANLGQQRALLLRGTKFVVAITLPLAIGVVAYGEDFIRIWIGEEHVTVPPGVAPFVVISFTVTVFILTATTILLGMAKVKEVFWMGIAELTLAVLLVLLSVPRFELRGLAGSLMLANILITFLWIVPYVCRLLGQGITAFLAETVIRPLAAAVPMALFLIWLEQQLPGASLWWIGFKLGLGICVYGVTFYSLSLTPEERELCHLSVRNMLRREPA
jgi:O-antigen/teichoic acid export membrane protein